jgi:hypothetical protein
MIAALWQQGPHCCLCYQGSAGAIDHVMTFIVNVRGVRLLPVMLGTAISGTRVGNGLR